MLYLQGKPRKTLENIMIISVESIRNINTIIKETKMMRLVDYIKNRLVG